MVDILMVEDNEELKDVLERFLLHEGYLVHCVGCGRDALQYLQKEEIRLLLVDIMLPDMDGFHICEVARKSSSMPILIMSARSAIDDKIVGYELGADDYIEKPFPIEVLLVKIKALLRRGYDMKEEKRLLLGGDITIDLSKRTVVCRGSVVALSMKEYEVLVLLMKHKNTTLQKGYLFSKIWGNDSESELSTLTVHMNTLREKLERDPKHPKHLVTVWGVGYRYESME